jgi:hypothetical protein
MRSISIHYLLCRTLLVASLFLAACGGTQVPDEDGSADAGTTADAGTSGRTDAGTQTPGGPISQPPGNGCVPQCKGKTCGSDGCGGACGTCPNGKMCNTAGQCICVPQCNGKACGSDGCGGTCGTCPLNATCDASGEACRCAEGYVPNPQHTGCIKLGGPCGGVSEYGYCTGDDWVRCDAQEGIVSINCGPGMCKTLSEGVGACRCGNFRGAACTSADGTASGNKVLFTCLTLSDVLVATNCAAETGSPNGFCSTYVTSVGYQTACFCDTCSAQLTRDNTCSPLCGQATCSYNPTANTHTCW